MSLPKKEDKYSYMDYQTWDEDKRLELIDGEIIQMSPAPSRKHQQILRELSVTFTNHLRDKSCEVFFAPFDVRLLTENKKDNEIDNVVQPDLSIICDRHKLDDRGCNGAPDMIIEIISASSVKMDRWKKFLLYEKSGVREYWLVDPGNESVEIHLLREGQYTFQGVFTKEDSVTVDALEGMTVDLADIFH